MLKNFWLKKTNLLTWQKLPKKAYIKKYDNKYLWFPDGKINIYVTFQYDLLLQNQMKIV